jgi:fido (protein-threonine AMPylation protein)
MMASFHHSLVLFPTPRLTSADQMVLASIDEMRDRLRHQVHEHPGKCTSALRKFLTADAVAASNSIEGFRVSTQDVQDLMDGERDVDLSDENRAETLAYQLMLTYVQSLHDARDFEYSKGLLNALHWMLQGHRHARNKPGGQWRTGQVYVTDPRDPRVAAYTAPAAADVPGLMAELVAWLNARDDTHPLIRAAMAHLHLVSIHPWADGNGRMSRSLSVAPDTSRPRASPSSKPSATFVTWPTPAFWHRSAAPAPATTSRVRAFPRRHWSSAARRSPSPRLTRTTDRRGRTARAGIPVRVTGRNPHACDEPF